MSSSHTPTSSPPSSPSFSAASSPSSGPCDSSPPSSPSHEPLSLSPPASPGLAHPYAASTKAVRPLPLYSKHKSDDKDDFRKISFGLDLLEDPGLFARDDHTTLAHPLAGSASSAGKPWAPPECEKKTFRAEGRTISLASTSSSDTSGTAMSVPTIPALRRDLDEESLDLDDEEDTSPFFFAPRKSVCELEEERWQDAINRAVDRADGIVDLSNSGVIGSGLTRISPSIRDLGKLVVLPSAHTINPTAEPPTRTFTRAQTMPANPWGDSFSQSRNASRLVKSPSMAHMRQPINEENTSVVNTICLYLANNAITQLPLDLFRLQGITVLNLRGNALERVPPQIANLKNLRILLLGQNKLTHLPMEMLNMCLTKLTLLGNPWLEPPAIEAEATTSTTAVLAPSTPSQHSMKPVTPTTQNFTIPHLTELCVRTLLSPLHLRDSSGAQHETVLEALHHLPLPPNIFSDNIQRDLQAGCTLVVVNAMTPAEQTTSPSKRPRQAMQTSYTSGSDVSGSFSTSASLDDHAKVGGAETHPGVGTCMSPAHQGTPAVFIKHAEERFTWERVIAGQDVDVDGGVPVLWRGCSRGCLNFLDGTTLRRSHRKLV